MNRQKADGIRQPDHIQIKGRIEEVARADLPGVTEYRVSEGSDQQGTVLVYSPGLKAAGYDTVADLPIPVPQMVGEQGLRLISGLSNLRCRDDYARKQLFDDETLQPTYLREDVGVTLDEAVGQPDLRFIGDPKSFRRHLQLRRSGDDGLHVIDDKIPGRHRMHGNVRAANFSTTVRVYNHYLDRGITPPMAAPVAFAEIPASVHSRCSDVRFYGSRRGDDFIPRYMLLQHLDGKRIITSGEQVPTPDTIIDPEYVGRVCAVNGLRPESVIQDMFAKPFEFLANTHEAGYCLHTDGHYGNFMLCTDGVVRSVSDTGSSLPVGEKSWDKQHDIRLMDNSRSTTLHYILKRDSLFQRWMALTPRIWEVVGDVSDGSALYRI